MKAMPSLETMLTIELDSEVMRSCAVILSITEMADSLEEDERTPLVNAGLAIMEAMSEALSNLHIHWTLKERET
jgi:hypothetical protein